MPARQATILLHCISDITDIQIHAQTESKGAPKASKRRPDVPTHAPPGRRSLRVCRCGNGVYNLNHAPPTERRHTLWCRECFRFSNPRPHGGGATRRVPEIPWPIRVPIHAPRGRATPRCSAMGGRRSYSNPRPHAGSDSFNIGPFYPFRNARHPADPKKLSFTDF